MVSSSANVVTCSSSLELLRLARHFVLLMTPSLALLLVTLADVNYIIT